MKKSLLLIFVFSSIVSSVFAQSNNDIEDQTGAWYMYFGEYKIKDSQFSFQFDVQSRNFDLMSDFEQLMLRGGLTYTVKNSGAKLTLGYANITSGTFGDSDEISGENRIFQEVLLPQKLGKRVYLKHRFRFEQRFVEGQDFRTRFRYNFFLNIPLNQSTLGKGAIYLAFYNELFINGQKDIGNDQSVEYFDINRAYGALGYSVLDNLKIQLGYMEQTKNTFSRGQIQLSVHHTF